MGSKRGLRVKTGVVVPSRPALIEIPVPGFPFPSPLVPLIRCTATPSCGFCWYCREHAKGQS